MRLGQRLTTCRHGHDDWTLMKNGFRRCRLCHNRRRREFWATHVVTPKKRRGTRSGEAGQG